MRQKECELSHSHHGEAVGAAFAAGFMKGQHGKQSAKHESNPSTDERPIYKPVRNETTKGQQMQNNSPWDKEISLLAENSFSTSRKRRMPSAWEKLLRFITIEDREAAEGIAWIEFAQPIYELIVEELNDTDEWELIEGTYFARGPFILKLDENGRFGVVGHFSLCVDTEMNMITDEDNITAFIKWIQDGNSNEFPAIKKDGK